MDIRISKTFKENSKNEQTKNKIIDGSLDIKNRHQLILDPLAKEGANQSKKLDTGLPKMNAEKLEKPEKDWERNGGQRFSDGDIQSWEKNFTEIDGLKYRFTKTSLGAILQLPDDDELLRAHADTEAEVSVSTELLKSLSMEKLAEMWKGKLGDRPDGYVPDEGDIPLIRREYLQEKLSPEQMAAYNGSYKNGEYTGATFTLLKETGAWEIFKLLAVTQSYHQFTKTCEESHLQSAETKRRSNIKGSAHVGRDRQEYEEQVNNNCFACAGSKVINTLLEQAKDKNRNRDKLDQYKIRSFKPRYLKKEVFEKLSSKDYREALVDIEAFTGEDKARFGNFFACSDVLFDKREYGGLGRRDIALQKSTFNLGKARKNAAKDNVIVDNIIEAIKQKLLLNTSNGKMTTLLTHHHYVTVTGINGNKISFLDSLPGNGHYDAEKVRTMDIRYFLKGEKENGAYDTVELTSAAMLDQTSRTKLQREYEGLGIDGETGEIIRKNNISTPEDVAHRSGIVITKSREELIRDGNEDIARFMTESICLHKGSFMSEEQLHEWERKDDAEWQSLLNSGIRYEAQSLLEKKIRGKDLYEDDEQVGEAQTQEKRLDGKALQTETREKQAQPQEEKLEGQTLQTETQEKQAQQQEEDKEQKQAQPLQTEQKAEQKEEQEQAQPLQTEQKAEQKESQEQAQPLQAEKKKALSSAPALNADKALGQEITAQDKKTSGEIDGLLEKLRRSRSFHYGMRDEGSSSEMEWSIVKAMRCMKFLDEEMEDEEILRNGLSMERTRGRANVQVDAAELAENCRIIEKLLSKVMSVDVDKELVAKEPEAMVDIYLKYEPLFTFARGSGPLMESLASLMVSDGFKSALTAEELVQVKARVDLIAAYGNYYRSVVLTPKKVKEVGESKSKDSLTKEKAAELSERINAKWDAEENKLRPFLKEIGAANLFKDHERMLSDRMGAVLRFDAGEQKDMDKELSLLAIRTSAANGDDDAEARFIYKSLKQKKKGLADEKARRTYSAAVERVIAAVLRFDLKKLPSAEGFSDPKHYQEFNDIALIAAGAGQLLEGYAGSLNKEQLSFVKDRIEILINARAAHLDSFQKQKAAALQNGEALENNAAIENGAAQQSGAALENGAAIEIQADKKEKAQEKKGQGEEATALLTKENEAKAGEILRQIEDSFANREATRRTRLKKRLDEAGKNNMGPASISLVKQSTLDGYAKGFKRRENLSGKKREEEMEKKGTELFKKAQNGKLLLKNAFATRDIAAKGRRLLSFDLKTMLDEDKLKAVSTFFSEDQDRNVFLVRRMAGKGNSLNARSLSKEEERNNKNAAMDMITERFLSLSMDRLDLSNDEKLAENAGRLEEISLKAQAFKTLLDADPEYRQRLSDTKYQDKKTKRATTLLDRVNKQMDLLSSVSDYYRARKLVMTDPHYIRHYNDEISLHSDKNDGKEQKRLSHLLNLSKEAGIVLNARMDMHLSGQWRINEEARLRQRRLGGSLAAEEENHKSRAFLDARLDLSQVTKENMQRLMGEIESFRKKYPNAHPTWFRDNWEMLEGKMDKLSPEIQGLIRTMREPGNDEIMIEHCEKIAPGLYHKMKQDTESENAESRIREHGENITFDNMHTQNKYGYGSKITRDLSYIIEGAESLGMSSEEALELFEGIKTQYWKDIDFSDPVETAKAEKQFLNSMAKLQQMLILQEERFLNTYGMLPVQLPPLALYLASGGKQDIISMRLHAANAAEDSLRHGNTVINGKNMQPVDAMVEKGLLTAEYVAKAREMNELVDGFVPLISNGIQNYAHYLTNQDKEDEDYQFEAATSEYYDSINSYRGKYDVPHLSEAKEVDGWLLFEATVSTSAVPKQYEKLKESNIAARNKEKNYTQSMVSLERFTEELMGVDTKGHSKEYIDFSIKFGNLRRALSTIAGRCPADGKNLDPQSMLVLRKTYDDAIRSSQNYLKDKKRNHSNALYRRRYDIVDEIRALMEKDYRILSEKNIDRSYSLSEALVESREAQATIDRKDIEVKSGAFSNRNVFDMELNGEKKKVLFTQRSALESKMKEENPLKEFSSAKGKWIAFPEFAEFSETEEGMDLIDKFLKSGPVYDYLKSARTEIVLKKNGFADNDTREFYRKRFMKSFEHFLRILPKKLRGPILKSYRAMSDKDRENVAGRLTEIGAEWFIDISGVRTNEKAGISIGSNIDMRNVAMTIVAHEIGTDKVIARSELANVDIIEEDNKKKEDNRGIIQEFVQGLSFSEVQDGIKDGSIVVDNEAALLEQLSEIQVTDYLCGNVDRHLGNVIFRMEQTDKRHPELKIPIVRIKEIVGVDNDMSFGTKRAEDFKGHTKRMSIPETMQVISRKLAIRILNLNKDRLFFKLGGTVTEEEKEAFWSRVEHMQLAIKDAFEMKKGLTIVEDGGFEGYSLHEIANANTEAGNLFRMMDKNLYSFGKKKERRSIEEPPQRLSTEELRVDMHANRTRLDPETEEIVGTSYAIDLYTEEMSHNDREKLDVLMTPEFLRDYYKNLEGAAKEFDSLIGPMLGNPEAENFLSGFSKAHGVNSIMDIFYINDKRAQTEIPLLNETIQAILKDKVTASMVPGFEGTGNDEAYKRSAVRDMIVKAYIMGYLAGGDKQITIANFQKDRSGRDELVITDLNPVFARPDEYPLNQGHRLTGDRDDSSLIRKSRKNREKRFAKIKEDVLKKANIEKPVKTKAEIRRENKGALAPRVKAKPE